MPKSRREQKRARREARRKAKRQEIQRAKSASRSVKSQLHEAADWPVMECWVNADWEDPMSLNQVIVARRNPTTGAGWAALCLVDRACLGGKDATVVPFKTAGEFRREVLKKASKTQKMVQVDFHLAAAIVQAGLDYAEDLGFKPHSDYKLAEILLKGADLEAVDVPIAVGGEDGKPFFVAGPYDNVDKIMRHLTERLGPKGFNYLAPVSSLGGLADFERLD